MRGECITSNIAAARMTVFALNATFLWLLIIAGCWRHRQPIKPHGMELPDRSTCQRNQVRSWLACGIAMWGGLRGTKCWATSMTSMLPLLLFHRRRSLHLFFLHVDVTFQPRTPSTERTSYLCMCVEQTWHCVCGCSAGCMSFCARSPTDDLLCLRCPDLLWPTTW